MKCTLKGLNQMNITNLSQQIEFLIEIDKTKQIFRNTILMDASRNENDAEHSWHMAIAAIVLKEYIDDKELDIEKVIKIALIHDIVEIDAGDIFAYNNIDFHDKYKKEKLSADRIFSILPENQKNEFINLWEEFEQGLSNEARYANALDCIMPILHNYYTKGLQWKRLGVTSDKVLSRNAKIEKSSKTLWKYIKFIVEDAVEKGYLNR